MPSHRLNREINLRCRTKAFKRKRLYTLWGESRWLIIGCFWVTAIILGYIGFYRYSIAIGERSTTLDLLYRAIQLTVFESGDVEGALPWQLEVARFLMPAVAGYAAIQAILAIYRDQWQIFRIRYHKNHLVLCGLGERGLKIAQEFFERGYRVVVIDADEENPLLRKIREQEAAVLIGDATDQDLLRKAGVHKAKYLIAVCADDGINAEIALSARSLSHLRKNEALTVFVHILDPELCNQLSSWGLSASKTGLFRLEFFNIMERGARIMLSGHPPFFEEVESETPPHLVLIGMGKIGNSLIMQAAKNWSMNKTKKDRRMQVIIVDGMAEAKIKQLQNFCPQINNYCNFNIHPLDFHLNPEQVDFLFSDEGSCRVNVIYICLDDDALALVSALKLYKTTHQYQLPLIVKMSRDAGLATLLAEDRIAMGFDYIYSFGLLDRTCSFDAVTGGIYEVIAQAIHNEYVLEHQEKGETVEINPSIVEWCDLSEEFKESNRLQATNVEVKLASINCGLQLLTAWDNYEFEFEPDEEEKLAQMEHERWCEEKTLRGWTYKAGPKNSRKKTNPALIPWAELDEGTKASNRNNILRLPLILAKAGFQIYRK
jgi:voltage-gated potassium channel Kch